MIDDTQELPAVRAQRRRGVPTVLALFMAAAVLAVIGTAAVVFFTTEDAADTSTDVAIGDDIATTDGAATPDSSSSGDAPQVETLPNETAGLWQVVGAERLNVRAGPGTSEDVIGSLAGGDRGVYATGERARVNGGEWKRIRYGDGDTYGWVAAGYLAPDTGEPAPTASAAAEPTATVSTQGGGALQSRLERGPACFLRDTSTRRIAIRLELDSGRVVGDLREDGSSTVVFASVEGGFAGADLLDATLTDTTDRTERDVRWTFNNQDIVLTDGIRVSSVPCVEVDPLFR